MKKVIFALAAVVALAACSQEDVIVADKGAAIGFDTFVENSTRSVNDPSYTNANMFADFAVFGYVEGAVLFDGVQVAKTITNNDLKSAWKYAGTQYWIAGAQYNFNAVAPMTNGNWAVVKKDAADNVVTNASQTTLSFTNNGTTDLLYATAAQEGKASGNTVVGFDFRHVLSKVKFSFVNNYNATNAKIAVRDIEIKNAYMSATATLNANTNWSNQAGTLVIDFDDATDDEATPEVKESAAVKYAYGAIYESKNERLMIPGTAPEVTYTAKNAEGVPTTVTENAYKVTFNVDLYVGETLVKTYAHAAYAKFIPAPGTCYDIKTIINASNIDPEHSQEPIEFTVNALPGWGEYKNVDTTVSENTKNN